MVYKIAERAKELGNMSIPDLRRILDIKSNTGNPKRGHMIEEILVDEFVEEYPKDICEE